jgi:hypothetical protein
VVRVSGIVKLDFLYPTLLKIIVSDFLATKEKYPK